VIALSWKTKVAIGATVLAGAVGVNQLLQVKTPDDAKRYQHEQQIEQGSDAVEMNNDRQRDKLPGGIDAENSRELSPREVRGAEPRLKLRLRP
jgi:hypothetical protein